MNGNMLYKTTDAPKKWYEWIVYPLQMVMSVFVATILIAQICHTPISACFLGGCIGTIIYQIITGFKSPMFISNSGATVSAVLGALVVGSGFSTVDEALKNGFSLNYFAVFIGGLIIFAVYSLFALIVKLKGINSINKIFPPTIVGAVTIVIGLNLAKFIPNYVKVDDQYSLVGIGIAIFTMIIIALVSHYGKGFSKTIPFLIGLSAGYLVSVIVTLTTPVDLIDFGKFNNMNFFMLPDFTFLHWSEGIKNMNIESFVQILLLFIPVSICALLEHYSDHKVLSNILNQDLTKVPGLHRTLIGDGLASACGTAICGLPNTSYGESIATIGFSRVASVKIVTVAATILGVLAFIEPFQVFVASIPSCVFGGCSMILYGYIAASGLKTIINNKVDLENNKNLIIVSVILTVGVGGLIINFPGLKEFELKETALAMILGVVLNLLFSINFKKIKEFFLGVLLWFHVKWKRIK